MSDGSEPALVMFGMQQLPKPKSYWMILEEIVDDLLRRKTLPFRREIVTGSVFEGRWRLPVVA